MDKIDDLVIQLRSSDPEAAGQAQKELIMIGEPAVPSLIQCLGNVEDLLAEIAGYAIVEIGIPAIPALIEGLRCDYVWGRGEWIISLLADIGKPALPALIDALGDGDKIVRCRAAEALGEIEDASAIPALINAMREKSKDADMHHDYSWVVCSKAVNALVKIGAPAVPAQVEVLADDDEDVISRASEVLVKIGKPSVPALIDAFLDSNAKVRSGAADALGKIMDVPSIPALVRVLMDDDIRVQIKAANALRNICKESTTIGTLDEIEKRLLEGYAAINKKYWNHERLANAGYEISKLMNEAAQKKNSLASKRDIHLGDIPKPPKKGGMYRTLNPKHRTISGSAMRRTVRNG